jgi:hypothetical protein
MTDRRRQISAPFENSFRRAHYRSARISPEAPAHALSRQRARYFAPSNVSEIGPLRVSQRLQRSIHRRRLTAKGRIKHP